MIKGKGPVHKLERAEKARMIESVLTAYVGRPPDGKTILDIGCGNGDISYHFSRRNTQYGVDVSDKRHPGNSDFQFAIVKDERLPFPDGMFDIVLSHHVIEHVDDQKLHLAEMRRVLREDGIAYIATPNRSSPIMQGHKGNDRVLRYRDMARLFLDSGFAGTEYSVDVVKQPDRFHSEVRGLSWLPRGVLAALRPLYPSHVFILSPAEDEANESLAPREVGGVCNEEHERMTRK